MRNTQRRITTDRATGTCTRVHTCLSFFQTCLLMMMQVLRVLECAHVPCRHGRQMCFASQECALFKNNPPPPPHRKASCVGRELPWEGEFASGETQLSPEVPWFGHEAQPGGCPSRCSLVTGMVQMLDQAPGPHTQLFGGAQQNFDNTGLKITTEIQNVWTTDNDG